MTVPLYKVKLTKRERFDLRTMAYFYPTKSGGARRVRYNDLVKMAQLSSKGIQPIRRTPGFEKLLWGKTYRDLHITMWHEDIELGIITKAEIYDSLPLWLRPWAMQKLARVPYDVDSVTGGMFYDPRLRAEYRLW